MLKDTVTFIAGAGLLGREFSKAVLENESDLILGDLDYYKLEQLKEELNLKYPEKKIFIVELNINSKESIELAFNKSLSVFKRIDALVNTTYPRNKNYGKNFFDVEYGDFCENISLHLGGYFLLSQQFVKFLIKKTQPGILVNISSVYGVIPPKFEIYNETNMTMPVEYAAIKSALIHLTEYMAKYLKGRNIRINCISPGGIFNHQDENFLNMYRDKCLNKGLLDPTDIVGTLVFLLSKESKYINGQNIIVDDGFVL